MDNNNNNWIIKTFNIFLLICFATVAHKKRAPVFLLMEFEKLIVSMTSENLERNIYVYTMLCYKKH